VLKALRKKPEERFASAREFREALAVAQTAGAPAPIPPQPEQVKRRSLGKPFLLASVAMAAVAMLGWVLLR
jgi:hypothetical protein